MDKRDIHIVVIGGSSGSIPLIMQIVRALPVAYPVPVVIVTHRLRNVNSDLAHVISAVHLVHEPEDKEHVENGRIYLAPQNYHLLIEDDHTFSMDYSELVNYSRPSIDVTFMSAASVYGPHAMGILLSGANTDGAEGLNSIIQSGGTGIAQDPAESEYPVMPGEAIKRNASVHILNISAIIDTLLSLTKK